MNEATTAPFRGRKSPYVVDAVLEMRRKGMLQFFGDVWREHGDLAHVQIGSRHMFLVTHPDHVHYVTVTGRQKYRKGETYDLVRDLLLGDGVLTATGDDWRRQRRLMAPFFTPRAVEQYYPVILADGEEFAERWDHRAAQSEPVEMIDEMMLVTASIILRTMFSTASTAELARLKDAVEIMIRYVSSRELNPLRLPLWIPIGENAAYLEAREQVHTFIDGVIAQRRALLEADWPDDLLSKLMLARDEETGAALSDKLLRDEAITIFFAGHETTARSMSFLWYALSEHPQVAAQLHAELDQVLGDRQPTIADLKQLPYSLQVIKETLRLYPAAPVYVRDAFEDDVIDGVPIPAGARMMLFPFLTHRHPEFWDEPERFDPDRWLPEREAARHAYAYHPFAAGQRICIGNNFSLFESHVLTAQLARRFAPRLQPGHVPQVAMAGTLVSENGLPMFIERR